MNTTFTYLYRDASNNKQWEDVVLAGQIEADAIRACLWEGDFFIPQSVGLPPLQERFAAQGYEFPTEDDHCWHEVGGVELTEAAPTVAVTATELSSRFSRCAADGWPAQGVDAVNAWDAAGVGC